MLHAVCKCKFGCNNNKCRCFKTNLACSSRCHNGTSCNNKGTAYSCSHMCMHYNEYCSTDDTIPCNHGDMQYNGKCRGKDTDEEHKGMQKITSYRYIFYYHCTHAQIMKSAWMLKMMKNCQRNHAGTRKQ